MVCQVTTWSILITAVGVSFVANDDSVEVLVSVSIAEVWALIPVAEISNASIEMVVVVRCGVAVVAFVII